MILGLDTKKVDYTCALINASITEDVYVRLPMGFEEEGNALKLKDHFMDCENLQEFYLNS